MLTMDDYGGSGWQICEAVRRTGGAEMLHIRSRPHRFGYPTDIDLDPRRRASMVRAQEAVNGADILHFKGDDLPSSRPWAGITIPRTTPTIITVGGSGFRRRLTHAAPHRLQRHPIMDYVSYFDSRVALTPDLNYEDFRGQWVPAAIDCDGVPLAFKAPIGANGKPKIIIGHSPSSRRMKGTDDVLVPAVETLRREGLNVELKIIEGVSHEECVDAKMGLTIFWDQCIVGAYGNSALEAMQFGIPTMCWLAPKTLVQARGRLDGCPMVNFDPTPDGCAEAIRGLLSQDLSVVARETRRWTREVHGYGTVGRKYMELYRQLADV